MNKKLLVFGAIILVGSLFFFGLEWIRISNIITTLNNIPHISNSPEFEVLGQSSPNTQLSMVVNNLEYTRTKTDSEGNFSFNISFKDEREYEMYVKPLLLGIPFGKESNTLKFILDTTPPSKDTFKVLSNIPSRTEESSLGIEVKIDPEDSLIVDENTYSPDSEGFIKFSKNLSSIFTNEIKFKLTDKAGNVSDIIQTENVKYYKYELQFLDSESFKCKNNSFIDGIDLTNDSYDKGMVCLQIAQWEGFNNEINQLPIEGGVGANITSVTVNDVKIDWDSKGNVFQRVPLMLYGGLNKYKVEIRDDRGNVATGFLSTTSELTTNKIDLNIY